MATLESQKMSDFQSFRQAPYLQESNQQISNNEHREKFSFKQTEEEKDDFKSQFRENESFSANNHEGRS